MQFKVQTITSQVMACNFQVQQLIAEVNEILAHDGVDKDGVWKKKLKSQSQELFELFPEEIQKQLLLERDPHGNVQVFSLFRTSLCHSSLTSFIGF